MPRTKDYSIREATEENFLELVVFAKEFYLNSHIRDVHTFSPKRTGESIENALTREDFGDFVLEYEEEIVGVLFSYCSPSFFSNDTQALCLAWYIRKEHRSLKNATGLVSIYEGWAKRQGACLMSIVNVNPNTPRAFERFGYKMNETIFSKEVG